MNFLEKKRKKEKKIMKNFNFTDNLALTYQEIEQKTSEISLSIIGNRKFCNTENILPYRFTRFTMQARISRD